MRPPPRRSRLWANSGLLCPDEARRDYRRSCLTAGVSSLRWQGTPRGNPSLRLLQVRNRRPIAGARRNHRARNLLLDSARNRAPWATRRLEVPIEDRRSHGMSEWLRRRDVLRRVAEFRQTLLLVRPDNVGRDGHGDKHTHENDKQSCRDEANHLHLLVWRHPPPSY